MDYNSLASQLDAAVDRRLAEAIALSDALAADPEISSLEVRGSRAHVEFLRNAGFSVEHPFFGIPTAYNASVYAGPGAKVALLAEYDALPEIGHACGHNVHGAMSLLAGAALASILPEVGGELWVTGTPAEETNGAKIAMSASGLFDDRDLALMIHSGGGMSYVRYRCLAMDSYEFRFKGRTAHAAASPWEGRNALNGVQLFFHSLDMLRQHVRPDVRLHGIITQGGAACNIVPEAAAARFYFRAGRRAYLETVMRKVFDSARGCALATDTEVEWTNFEASFDEMRPNDAAEAMMEDVYREVGEPFDQSPGPQGSSDVGNVSMRCPAVQPTLSIIDKPFSWHTREFAQSVTGPLAHRAIAAGARILARAALRAFTDPDLRARMRADFEAEKSRHD
ncbi:MAG TPA: amidohydrolase [Magnetospirillaceae bacterium]|nr:amidohydrolase [Magnetospirillaceae bacterium]